LTLFFLIWHELERERTGRGKREVINRKRKSTFPLVKFDTSRGRKKKIFFNLYL
jgi:hypothetical protein